MHLRAVVAGHAIHPFQSKVSIARDSFMFAQIFVADPAAVAGRAVLRHRRSFADNMPVDEPTANRVWLADMAISAAGVAG